MTSERTCPFCKDAKKLVMEDGHLTCQQCLFYLVRKGEPGFDEGFGSRIGKDEYWMIKNPLKIIE